MEAKWQKQHDKIMEFEASKNKLIASNELLEKEKYDLQQSLSDIKKDIDVCEGKVRFLDNLIAKGIREFNQQNEVLSGLIENNRQKIEQQGIVLKNLSGDIETKQQEFFAVSLKNDVLQQQKEILISETLDIKISKQKEENKKINILKQLQDEINVAQQQLDTLVDNAKSIQKETERQSSVLAVQKHDLEIYERRMKEKYPNETFIINHSTQ